MNIFFVDENNGWIAGSNLLKTTDGGKSWDLMLFNSMCYSVYFLNKNKGFMFVKDEDNNGFLLKSVDGGYNWDTLLSCNSITDVYFIDSSVGFAVGYSTFLRTTNGGESWDRDDNLFGLGISFCSPELGFLVGTPNGFRTTDGGKNWIADAKLYGGDVFFIDSLTGLITSGRKLSKTYDGGKTFITIINDDQGIEDYFSGLQFVNENVGFVFFGYHDVIMKTYDGGSSWDIIFSGGGYHPTFFLNENLGWTAGPGGDIWKYTDEPFILSQDENKIVNSYSLYQNYPNPFNPTTTIKYSIPKQNFVSLKVYDVLGNEVNTLVNEEKPAGEYEVTFNASGLSSGVYFYRIVSGTFVSTKKLLLMK